MKFKISANSISFLNESKWHQYYGNRASIAADLIEDLLRDEKADFSQEERLILNRAHEVLYDNAPYMKESLKESSDQKVRLYVEFYPYERYGSSEGLKRATVSGTDKLDAIKRLVDHMGLYIDSEIIEEANYSFEDVINSIVSSNGDGCDFIVVLKNKNSGEIYIEEDYEEEEDWDDDFDESLKESSTSTLSDKSNSISGLLLSRKDEIDSATSQPELIKVCSDILAEKGGAKAQQFLAVLRTKKNHYAALKYVYDFILAGEGMRSPDSKRKTRPTQQKESIKESITEDDLIKDGFQRVSGRRGYDFYRKLVDGKGKWYAAKDGEVMPITYDQARGYEPLNSEESMSMRLGHALLPR